MLKNYFKIALRNLWRNKIYTFINLMGLSIGIASSILLYLYLQDELSFDTHHSKADRLYRMTTYLKIENSNEEFHVPVASNLLADRLKQDFPEVEKTAKIFRGSGKKPITYKDKKLFAYNMYYADSTYFELFDHQFIKGNPSTALKNPNSIVLTETLAKKIFGSVENAYEKTLLLFDYQNNKVTAIIEDVPQNSHLRFPALVSMHTLEEDSSKSWVSNIDYPTYVLLKEGTDIENFQKKLQFVADTEVKEAIEAFGFQGKAKTTPQLLTDIHLNSQEFEDDYANTSSIDYIYIFIAIAIFILVIASINYMNLATARSTNRAKEVGIRKVVGSYRMQLIFQFLVESILLTSISFVLALLWVETFLPFFESIVQKQLSVPYFTSPIIWLVFIGMILLVGFLSGSYPAFFLSSFKPVIVLKGKFIRNPQTALLRKVLVVFQFSISIVMIIGTWIVYQQLNYIQEKDLGLDKEHVLMIETFNDELFQKMQIIGAEMEKNPNIKGTAGAFFEPGDNDDGRNNGMKIELDNGEYADFISNFIAADYDYLDLMKIRLIEGRFFSRDTPSDTVKSLIVNQTFVKQFGLKNPIGKNIIYNFDEDGTVAGEGKIIGVVADFHIASLHNAIRPTVIGTSGENASTLYIKITGKNIPETMAYIQKVWEKFDKKYPFEAQFIEDNFMENYVADQKRGQIFLAFSGLTILIACLGLFGLSSFMIEQKTKEIGIRKVLGASIQSILLLVSKDFIRIVLVANLIAIPFAYWIMSDWLTNFAYHVGLSPFVFIFAGLLVLLVALITVSTHALKATTINPIAILKDE